MAARKNYYGVKKGKRTGIFRSWEACREAVDGFPGAEYKGFVTYEEVCAYLGLVEIVAKGRPETSDIGAEKDDEICKAGRTAAEDSIGAKGQNILKLGESVALADNNDCPPEGSLLAYVDGSYDHSIPKYAFGCVFLLPDGRIFTEFGNGDNPLSLQQRNVAGEMLGAMYAVKTAMMNGFRAIEIRYDYEGIEKWVTGAWRSKTELTQKYAKAMGEWSQSIAITFTKVPAHSNVKYNEMADQVAKAGLTQADGVPRVKRLEEMKEVL